MSSYRLLQRLLLMGLLTAALALSATGAQAATNVVNARGGIVEDFTDITTLRAALAANQSGSLFFTHTVSLTGTLSGTGQMSEKVSAGLNGAVESFVVTTFTGTITGPDGKPNSGTIQIVDSAIALPGSDVFNGTFSLQNGTGELAGVRGQGTLTVQDGVGTYQGQIFFP